MKPPPRHKFPIAGRAGWSQPHGWQCARVSSKLDRRSRARASYTLYYSQSTLARDTNLDTADRRYARCPISPAPTHTVTGLTNGTRYYFVVRAINADNQNSAASAQASAIPLAMPTDLSLTAGDAQVAATWSAASGASSYTLYYATTPLAGATDLDTRASGITRLTGLTSTWLTVTGLSNGTRYYFVVRADQLARQPE